jgi:hypothetical protein
MGAENSTMTPSSARYAIIAWRAQSTESKKTQIRAAKYQPEGRTAFVGPPLSAKRLAWLNIQHQSGKAEYDVPKRRMSRRRSYGSVTVRIVSVSMMSLIV